MNIPQRRQINLSRGFIKLNKHAYNNPSVTAFTSGCVPSLTNRVFFDHTKALLDLCVSLVFYPSGNRKFVQKHTKEYCSVLLYIMLLFIHKCCTVRSFCVFSEEKTATIRHWRILHVCPPLKYEFVRSICVIYIFVRVESKFTI